MPDTKNSTTMNRLKRFLMGGATPTPEIPDNLVDFVPNIDPDETLLFCAHCDSPNFLITGAYKVRCANCCNEVVDISTMGGAR